jgi:hypothetical protein
VFWTLFEAPHFEQRHILCVIPDMGVPLSLSASARLRGSSVKFMPQPRQEPVLVELGEAQRLQIHTAGSVPTVDPGALTEHFVQVARLSS